MDGDGRASPASAAVAEEADTGTPEAGGTGERAAGAVSGGRRRARRVLFAALGLLGMGIVLVAGAGWWTVDHYTARVDRIPDVFPSRIPRAAQPAPAEAGETFLLVGVDSRSDLPTTGRNAKAPEWTYGAQRSDTMMLVHLPADHSGAYVVSLPRDSWVDIPGHGRAKLNAAFSWGGPPLLIDTVQRLTEVKIDHLGVIDWDGFKRLTDAVGGVDLTVDGSRRHLDGAQALAYVRERYSLARGDLDRTHRQQNFLRAVLSKVMTPGNFTNPLKAAKILDRLTESVSVDDRLSDSDLRGLLWDSKGVRPSDMVFMNAPVTGTDMIGGQSVVLLDKERGRELWTAMRSDALHTYVSEHDVDRLGSTTP